MLNEIIENVKKSEEFKNYSKETPDAHLAHIFKMFDEVNVKEMQIGFYSREKGTVTTFVYNEKDKTIKKNPESEAFKKEEHIEPLDLSVVEINLNQAMNKVDKLRQEKYSQHPIEKSFTILQNHEHIMWNFTFVTKTFHVLNIKLNATNGEIISDELTSIFDFKSN